jgi:ankyrin repeat protein
VAAFDGNGVSFLRAISKILPPKEVIKLLQMRSRDCKTGRYGNTPVNLAAKRSNGGDFVVLMGEIFTKDLLVELLGMPGRLNYSPLHTAIESGNGDTFLRAEARVLEDDKDALMELLQKRSLGGRTPLHEAACTGEKSVKLVKTVAQILGEEKFVTLLGEVDDYGNTPIFEATIHYNEAFLNAVRRILPPQFYITSRRCIRL